MSPSNEVQGPGSVAFWPRLPQRHTPFAKWLSRGGQHPAWVRQPRLHGAVHWDFSHLGTAARGSLYPGGATAAQLRYWVPLARCLWLLVVQRGGGPATLGQVDPVVISRAAAGSSGGRAGELGSAASCPSVASWALSDWQGVARISSHPSACSRLQPPGRDCVHGGGSLQLGVHALALGKNSRPPRPRVCGRPGADQGWGR